MGHTNGRERNEEYRVRGSLALPTLSLSFSLLSLLHVAPLQRRSAPRLMEASRVKHCYGFGVDGGVFLPISGRVIKYVSGWLWRTRPELREVAIELRP